MKKSVIIAIIAIVLAVVVIVVGVIFGLRMAKGNGEVSDDISQKEIYQHDVGEMYSNLSESKKLVKVSATVETTEEEYLETLESKNYIIRNEINEIIRSKKLEEIEGSEGQKNLQSQIVTRLNEVFNTKVISDVYFNDFIVQ